MRRPRTDQDYAARIARVVDHIAANLDAPLDLERLAEVACFSPYHFHRIYRGIRGETPDQTVRRLRLHRAAVSLTRSDAPLAQIAAGAGYSSVEAFSRAFARSYGRTPAAYRTERRLASPTGSEAQSLETDMHDIEIIAAPAYRLLGLPHRGSYDLIGGAFEKLSALAAPLGALGAEATFIGVYYDDPETVPAAELRSFAGVATTPDMAPQGDLEIVELVAGPAARLIHKGPYAELEPVYKHLYGVWLPSSGREPADTPCYEIYLNDPATTAPLDLLTEVRLPLAA